MPVREFCLSSGQNTLWYARRKRPLVLSALAYAAAPTEKIGPRHFYELNAVLFFFPFVVIDFRALWRMHFRNVHICGRGRAGRAVKASGAHSHRQIRDYELNAGNVGCRGRDDCFRATSDAKDSAGPERCAKLLGMAR